MRPSSYDARRRLFSWVQRGGDICELTEQDLCALGFDLPSARTRSAVPAPGPALERQVLPASSRLRALLDTVIALVLVVVGALYLVGGGATP